MNPEAPRLRPMLPALLGLALLVGGCGGGDDGPAVHPVTGKLLVDGKPAAKALITFHPAPGSPHNTLPYAETDADGTFRPSTRLSGDGAPAGEYTLTVLWPEVKVDHGEEIAGRDRLGGQYGAAQSSNLKVTIKEGENTLPSLDLKAGRRSGIRPRAR